MAKNCHLEELRDLLEGFEQEAQFLYQYGSLSGPMETLSRLSYDDQRRLIALALIEGNTDIKNVACHLMGKLIPAPINLEQLKSQMSPEYQEEVDLYGKCISISSAIMSHNDKLAIIAELQEACNTLGLIEVEEAYWVFIPVSDEDDIIWSEAMGGENDFFNNFRSTLEIGYSPSISDLHELISDIRNAKWVLHIHNHPGVSSCIPSDRDFCTALSWKSVRPELAHKMKFFVVQANIAIEYGAKSGELIRWI